MLDFIRTTISTTPQIKTCDPTMGRTPVDQQSYFLETRRQKNKKRKVFGVLWRSLPWRRIILRSRPTAGLSIHRSINPSVHRWIERSVYRSIERSDGSIDRMIALLDPSKETCGGETPARFASGLEEVAGPL